MFLLLWYVFILFNSLSLLFDCFPCVQLNSEVPLQNTKGYNDMTMLQSSQYLFSYFFLFLFENLFWSWRGRLRREESVTGRRRGRATETQTASGRTSQQGQACIKAYTLLVSFFFCQSSHLNAYMCQIGLQCSYLHTLSALFYYQNHSNNYANAPNLHICTVTGGV